MWFSGILRHWLHLPVVLRVPRMPGSARGVEWLNTIFLDQGLLWGLWIWSFLSESVIRCAVGSSSGSVLLAANFVTLVCPLLLKLEWKVCIDACCVWFLLRYIFLMFYLLDILAIFYRKATGMSSSLSSSLAGLNGFIRQSIQNVRKQGRVICMTPFLASCDCCRLNWSSWCGPWRPLRVWAARRILLLAWLR